MSFFMGQLINGISLGFALATVALGFSIVFGTLRVVNFAHGHLLMLAGFVGWITVENVSSSPLVVLLVVAVFGAFLSAALYLLLIRPVTGKNFLSPFVTTFGAGLLFQAFAKEVWKGDTPRAFDPDFQFSYFTVGSVRISNAQIGTTVAALTLMLAVAWLLFRTRIGTKIRVAAHDPEVARASGIDVTRVAVIAMGIAGALAGVAAALLGYQFGAISAYSGEIYGIKGMLVMVIGGVGSLPGAVAAGLLVGTAESLTAGYISTFWRDAVAICVLLCVLLLRPAGLFGKAGRDLA